MKSHKQTLNEWRLRRKKLVELHKKGVRMVDLAKMEGISRQRVYNILKEEESKALTSQK